MATGDITYKYVKITVDDETGVINYAEEKYIEDADGVKHQVGKLHRPGVVAPRKRNADNTGWIDNIVTDKPQVIQDLAEAMWSSTRKTAYENKNS